MANYLSASRRIPLLDLAKVPVSTGSLRALFADLVGSGDAVESFQMGTMPIIVDALDEGRLLSGETGFESFLETTGELLLEDRSVSDSPKLIIFGRYDSTELTKVALEIYGPGVTSCSVDVGYFGEESAWKLIDAYAQSVAPRDAAYRKHPGPVRELIKAYFDAIESALGLNRGELWETDRGRAFAGYAPVLAAVGSLLAELENFIDVANRLRSSGAQEAWDVIETVLQEILEREKRKLCEQLRTQVTVSLPDETYDSEEQLTLLTRYVHSQPLEGTGRVQLGAADQAKYHSMVERYLPEHPFVRQGQLGNVVLGSVVLAHAVNRDLLKDTELTTLIEFSRQPFLWRSLRRELHPDSLLDGRYAGCILNSFWNDPITEDRRVLVRSANDRGGATVRVPNYSGEESVFEVTLPLVLHGQARDLDVDVRGRVRLEGHAPRGSEPAFYVHGTTTIICESMEIAADRITLEGRVWFEAEQILAPPRLDVRFPKNGATEVGWGGQFAATHPWNRFRPTLRAPYPPESVDALTNLIEECWQRLPEAGSLTLYPDYSIPEDDVRMGWALRRFPSAFGDLIKLMVDHGLASREEMSASGTRKVRVHFEATWGQLREALRGDRSDPKLARLVDEARRTIGGR